MVGMFNMDMFSYPTENPSGMTIAAYICLGDPAWIEASVKSYYPYVSKIVATYDCDGLSWSGPKIDVGLCIERLKKIDTENKVCFVAGKFSIEANFDNPMLSDTYQRKFGLELASKFGDWVLQLDTDEIIPNWPKFAEYIDFADKNEFDAVYFPAIYVYQMISKRYALESCRRWGERQTGYPGPLCVRSGSTLYLSRRSLGATLHVPCSGSFNTLIETAATLCERSVVETDCVVHITKGRTPEYMEQKFRTWSHAKDRDYSSDLKYWQLVRKYPWLFLFVSHVLRGTNFDKFRLFKIHPSIQPLIGDNTLDGDSVSSI